jgi:hypothetical protein
VWPRSTTWICAAVTARSWYSTLIVVADEVGQRAGELDPGGAAADDDEVQRALVDERRVAVGLLEERDDARAQPLGVVEAVERERVLLRARACGRSSACDRRRAHRVAGEAACPSVWSTVRDCRVQRRGLGPS